MNFEFEYIKVSLNWDEAWTIMFALLREAFNENEIKTHWSSHGEASFLKNRSSQISLAESFCRSMGRPDLFEDKKKEALALLEKEVEARKSK